MGFTYLGNNRGLVDLANGLKLVIDTNSIDSLDYIMGWEYERDVILVLKKCITSHSVFIDVGANFGFYTVSMAPYLQNGGFIYAFEAHPLTFDLLQRSLYVNHLLNKPFLIASNAAVSDRSGRDTLKFRLDALGGASLWGRTNPGMATVLSSVEVNTVSLDEFLPQNVIADVVKIDVEAHEPFVLRGMKNIIARSPNIKIICEFNPEGIGLHSDPVEFIEDIYRSDLRIWTIRSKHDGTLVEFDGKYHMKEAGNILLARTIDDLADHTILPIDLSYPDIYFDGPVNRLLRDGCLVYRKDEWATPDARLCFGPYFELERGKYRMQILGVIEGKFEIFITKNFGQLHFQEIISESRNMFEFSIPERFEKTEIVIDAGEESQYLKLASIKLDKID